MADRQSFWKRLDAINAGMLGTAPALHFVPMSHHADPDADALWFITAQGTELTQAAASGPVDAMYLIGDASGKLWARIAGQLEQSQDHAKLEQIWSAVASAWFEQGKADPDLRLLKLSLTGAEVWSTPGGLGFLYEIAKARLTGEKPDMGEHFTLTF